MRGRGRTTDSLAPGSPHAYAALQRELADADALGLLIPCRGPEARTWTLEHDEDPEGTAVAALLCGDCPVVEACAAAGEGERAGLWGAQRAVSADTRRSRAWKLANSERARTLSRDGSRRRRARGQQPDEAAS